MITAGLIRLGGHDGETGVERTDASASGASLWHER